MPQILDFIVMKPRKSRAKKSNAGRKKNRWFTLKLVAGGRESFVKLRPETVATLAGVSKQTVYHWIAGTKTPAPTTLALLEIVAGGTLPWHGWWGWRMCGDTGRLIAPNGYSFHSGELAWWSIQKQLIRELERDNAGLKLQLATLRAQVNEQAANNLLHFPQRKHY